MINICDLKTIGDDVQVITDIDLYQFFNSEKSLVLEEHNDFNNKEMRYFLLKKASYKKYFDVYVTDRKTFNILGINQPASEMNLMMGFVGLILEDSIIFFELHSGLLYPLIDGTANVPELLSKKITYNGKYFLEEKNFIFNSFHNKFVNESFLKKIISPILFLFNSHYIDYGYYSALKLSQEDINFLNENGLTIFLSEPILDEMIDSPIHYNFNVLYHLNNFATNNNLKNVKVNLCEYNFCTDNNLYSNLKIECNDIFLKLSSYEYKKNNYPKNKYIITKKFWSGNWIYKYHRYIIASSLVKKSSNLSWHYNFKKENSTLIIKDYTFFKENKSFLFYLKDNYPNLFNQTLENIVTLETSSPVKMDSDAILKNNINDYTLQSRRNNGYSHSLSNYYNECFLGVITETVFDYPYPVLSEKTLCCMINLRPFILVAPENSLTYLKELGFKTFSNWWDESYDKEKNNNDRMIKILNLINQIENEDVNYLNNLLEKQTDILEHNRQLALNLYK